MLTIRNATVRDAPLIVTYIKELAEYEKLTHECHATEENIVKWLFSAEPKAHCLMTEWNGEAAGFALYFNNFSTFLGKPGIYIEDIFIRPEFRRNGIAKALFKHLANIATNQGYGRLEWWVLDWNKPALDFYTSLGAKSMSEWTVQRVSGEALLQLAKK